MSLSVLHWVWTIAVLASRAIGIFRSFQNRSILNAALSAFIPGYGFVYFVVGKRASQRLVEREDPARADFKT
ncbi:hypothetical protein Q2941_42625 [Bradyrhizobium sp. UFLA05-153]